MRALFGMLGLVVVVALVGLLSKKQLQAASPAPANGTPSASAAVAPQQQVEQMRQAAEAALQTPRGLPDDPK